MNYEAELREYLLGRLPESETEALEKKLLDDEDLFLTARSIEDDLVDDFARNELASADREAFASRYRGQPSRLLFANALAQRGSNVVAFPRNRWFGWAAAAAVGVVALTVVLEERRTPVLAPTVIRRQAKVPVLDSAAATVTLASSRAASAATVVTLPKNVSTLQLRVRLNPEDRFERYALEVRSNRLVWRGDDLHASSEGGELALSAAVPASSLENGSYEVSVQGSHPNASPEDLGFVSLEIRRSQ